MQIDYQVQGPTRKEMAKAISEVVNEEVSYSGVPKCEYHVGPYTITKEGNLMCEDGTDTTAVVEALAEKGWIANASDSLSISVPRNTLDDEALARLKSLIEAKGTLMKHAFKTDELKLEVDEEKITFPWFELSEDSDRTNAYLQFIQAICKMASEQKRIQSKEREIENEKYAFRCFLLRLGFIGKEFKSCRKVLMENLEGSSAFKVKKEEVASVDE